MEKSELMPIIDYAVEKVMRQIGKNDPEEIRLAKEAITTDTEVSTRIAALVKLEPKPPLPVPEPFARLGAFVRPVVTLLLAATFVFLIVSPFLDVSFLTDIGKDWDKIFSSFMGVFGAIIGFWFGERSALKVPGGGKEPPKAAEKKPEEKPPGQ